MCDKLEIEVGMSKGGFELAYVDELRFDCMSLISKLQWVRSRTVNVTELVSVLFVSSRSATPRLVTHPYPPS